MRQSLLKFMKKSKNILRRLRRLRLRLLLLAKCNNSSSTSCRIKRKPLRLPPPFKEGLWSLSYCW